MATGLSLNISQVFQTCEIFTRASRMGSGLPLIADSDAFQLRQWQAELASLPSRLHKDSQLLCRRRCLA
jgi:hypothetical protein